MTTYSLKDPIPEIQNRSYVAEICTNFGSSVMWNDGTYTYFFGGFGIRPYFGHFIILDTGDHYLITGQNGVNGGATYSFAYHPVQDKLYIGSNYDGQLAEFDSSDHSITSVYPGITKCNKVNIGDDGLVYYLDYANPGGNQVYSYNPTNADKKEFGAVPNSNSGQSSAVGADSSYLYCVIVKGDDSFDMYQTPTTGSINWQPWGNSLSSDIGLQLNKVSGTGTPPLWGIERQLADSSYKYYTLSGGVATFIDNIRLPVADETGAPNYSYQVSMGGNFSAFLGHYDWEMRDTDMVPVQGPGTIYTVVGYRQYGEGAWTDSSLEFTGPWNPSSLTCVTPRTGQTFFSLTQGYCAALNYNATIETYPECTSYLGNQILSAYAIKKHPSNGLWYFAGYANKLLCYNPIAEWTLNNSNTTPVLPIAEGKPNPYVMQLPVPGTPGGTNYRNCIDFDSSGFLWVGNNETFGDVMWYDPGTGDADYVFGNWDLTSAQFMNLCSCLNKTKILVSDNLDNIYRVDAATQTDDDVTINPMGEASKSRMIEVSYDRVFVVTTTDGSAICRVGILRPSTMPLTPWIVPLQSLGVSGQPFGYSDNHYDRMFWKLEMGPDGYIWMFVGNSLYRIDPASETLTFEKIADTAYGSISFAANGTDLLIHNLDGDTDTKYILGILIYEGYSKGAYSILPGNDDDLLNIYTDEQIVDVATDDTDMVAQLATSQIAIHQFKRQINGTGGLINVVAQVTIPCSTSTAYLQIYNRSGTPAWDTIDSDNATGSNTDFTLSATVADLTDYKDINNIVSCRVYQEMQ